MTTKILLTGGTGFIGSHLAIELLKQPRVSLVLLARGKKRQSALQRVQKSLRTALEHQGLLGVQGWSDRINESVDVVDADLADADIASQLGSIRVDVVWHCAGKVSFSESLSQALEAINARSTQRLLEWASIAGCSEFNYVSTAYVAPAGLAEERVHAPQAEANNPYEVSKRTAEQHVLQARESHRLAFRIFRPSIVVADSRTGKGETAAGLYGFLILADRLRQEVGAKIPGYFEKFPVRLHTSAAGDLNLIPVDAAVQQMVAVASKHDSLDQIYNIVSERNVKIAELAMHTRRELGIGFIATANEADLGPVDIIINKEVELFAPYLRRAYTFTNKNVREVLGEEYLPSAVDQDVLARLVNAFFVDRPQLAKVAAGRGGNWLDSFEKREIARGAESESIRYYCGGQGVKTLLIVNAYGQSLYFWSRLASLLISEYRIIVWEMRGTSCTAGGMTHAVNVHEHVEDALAIAEHAQVHDCDLMAWCTGPKLAVELWRRKPDLMRTITFITPAFKGLPGLEQFETRYEKYMEPLCRRALQQPESVTSVRNALSAILAGKATALEDADTHEKVRAILSLMDEELRTLVVAPFVDDRSLLAYAGQLIDFWEHDVSATMAEVNKPVLLLTGAKDDIASEQRALHAVELMPQYLACSFVNGNHYIHFENAAQVASLFKDFVESTSMIPTLPTVAVLGHRALS